MRRRARLPVRGAGPLLRAPMVVDVGPPGNPCIGDVIVFRRDGRSFAHRVVRREPGLFVTASDARPWETERVAAADVLGRVEAVWSDGSDDARRVDRGVHRVAAIAIGRANPLYARALQALRRTSDLAARIDLRRRDRPALRIVAALRAAHRRDAAALAHAVNGPAEPLLAADARHRCLTIIGEAARAAGITAALTLPLVAGLRQARLAAVLGNTRLHRALLETVRLLAESEIPFVLLKGAARCYAGRSDAALHASNDLDVLVPRDAVEPLAAYLQTHGYRYGDDDDAPEHYRRHHHHAAALFPPGGEFPLEIHHALAPPGSLTFATDWTALAPHVERVPGPAGEVAGFDAVATALHLAIHAIGLSRLRDVALLACAMRALDAGERLRLQSWLARERRDGVRLRAAAVLAARIAGLHWPSDAASERYIRWALAREDLPRALRERCAAIERLLARPHRPWEAAAGLLPWRPAAREIPLYPLRVAGRFAANLAAAAGAGLLSPLR